MAANGFWIAFDLSPSSDLTGFYTWLDSMQAKECGKNFAFFNMNEGDEDPVKLIKKEIATHVGIRKRDRVYLIYKEKETGKIKGTFIFGVRKWARWTGWASISLELLKERKRKLSAEHKLLLKEKRMQSKTSPKTKTSSKTSPKPSPKTLSKTTAQRS
jgi:hypothetical protein